MNPRLFNTPVKIPELALTVNQPWASLIAAGLKFIENRSWKPGDLDRPHRSAYVHNGVLPVAIHASKNPVDPAGEPLLMQMAQAGWPRAAFPRGVFVGVVSVTGFEPRCATPWHMPDYAYQWWLRDAVALARTVEQRGRERLWAIPVEKREQILCQVQASLDLTQPGRVAIL